MACARRFIIWHTNVFLYNITWPSLCPIICSRTLISPYCLLLSCVLRTLISHCYKLREPPHPLLWPPVSAAAFYSSGFVHFPQHKACTLILHHFFNLNCMPHSNQRNLITAKLQMCPLVYSSAFLSRFESWTDVLILTVSILSSPFFKVHQLSPYPTLIFSQLSKSCDFPTFIFTMLYCPHICFIFTLFPKM